jgi:HSP20 family molecular chaperone IbpA
MRLRFRSISYTVGRTPASLERHYRELREAMLRAGQHYGLQPDEPWRPPIDIHETPDAIRIKVELAGAGEEDFEITLYDNALVVSGQRKNDVSPDEFVYYHEAQVRYGPFRADVLLPFPVDRDAVVATYEQGFLRVRLPKAQATANEARDESEQAPGWHDDAGSGESPDQPNRRPDGEAVGADGVTAGARPERIVRGAALTGSDAPARRRSASAKAF